jgi:hypothetical protein
MQEYCDLIKNALTVQIAIPPSSGHVHTATKMRSVVKK